MQVLNGHDKWDIDKEAPLSLEIFQIDSDDSDDFGDFFIPPSLVVGTGDASYSPQQPPSAAVRLEGKEHGRPFVPDMFVCTSTPFTQHPHNAGIGESAEHNTEIDSLAPTTFQSNTVERRVEDLIERRPRPLFDQSFLAKRRRYSSTHLCAATTPSSYVCMTGNVRGRNAPT